MAHGRVPPHDKVRSPRSYPATKRRSRPAKCERLSAQVATHLRHHLSVIKADIGGYVGHSSSHPDILATAKESQEKAEIQCLLMDYNVTACGDDLQLIMTHQHRELNERIHKLAWDTFIKGTDVSKKLKLCGAGQDLLADACSGNVTGMGHGVAEMAIEERASEPIIIFVADKTVAGPGIFPHITYIRVPIMCTKLK